MGSQFIKIPGENFQGGAAGGSDLGNQLNDAELNNLSSALPNQIIDAFAAEDRGAKSGLQMLGSALRFNAGVNTGTYERLREATGTLKNISGYAQLTLQHLAPNATAIASNTIVFSGNVAEFFPTASIVGVCSKISSDGTIVHKWLCASDGQPCHLAVTSCTYSAGPDTTTLVLANPESLDLSMGLSAANYNGTLRMVPLDWKFESKSLTSSQYEQIMLDNMFGTTMMRLPGENFYAKLNPGPGSLLSSNAVLSSNKQWGFRRDEVKTSGNAQYNWFYSVDGGKTWPQFALTTSAGGGFVYGDGDSSSLNYAHPMMLSVSDDGKAMGLFVDKSGYNKFYLVYCNLALGTTLTNYGLIYDRTSVSQHSWGGMIGSDPVDASYTGIIFGDGGSSLGCKFLTWASGASAPVVVGDAGQDNSIGWAWGSGTARVVMAGSGSSHRFHAVVQRATSGRVGYPVHHYWDTQGNYTNGLTTNTSELNNTVCAPVAMKTKGGRVFVIFDEPTFNRSLYQSWADNAQATGGAMQVLSTVYGYDRYYGIAGADSAQNSRVGNRTMVFNPNDTNNKHVMLVWDALGSDSVARSTLFEITDYTAIVGAHTSQYTDNDYNQVNSGADRQKRFAIFTANSSRTRTVAVKMYTLVNSGVYNLPSNAAMYLDIYNSDGTKPTTLVTGNTQKSVLCSNITRSSSGQWMFFNYNAGEFPTLTPGTKYCLVVSPSYATGNTTYVNIKMNTAGGNFIDGTFNGTSWTALSEGWCAELNGEWITDMSAQASATDMPNLSGYPIAERLFSSFVHNWESQIETIDANTVQHSMRRVTNSGVANYNTVTGHIIRRAITWGTAGIKSSITDAKIAGYATNKYDPNLIINMSLGHDGCSRIDPITGVVSSTAKAESRDGHVIPVSDYTYVPAWTTNSAFVNANNPTGQCAQFGASTGLVRLAFPWASGNGLIALSTGVPFAIEAEILPNTNTGNHQPIISVGNTGGSAYGWLFAIGSTGYLILGTSSANGVSSTNTIASDMIEPLNYHKVRATYDGTTVRLYRSTTALPDVFTEVSSYSSQQPLVNNSGSYAVCIGSYVNASGVPVYSFNGLLGNVKMAWGSTTFLSTGFNNQAALVAPQNLGIRIAGRQVLGQNGSNLSNVYVNSGTIQGDASQAAVVDSYDQIASFAQTLQNPQGGNLGFKLTMNRGSARNQSSVQGINFKFDK